MELGALEQSISLDQEVFRVVWPYFTAAEYSRPCRVRDPGPSSCGVVFLGVKDSRPRDIAQNPQPSTPSHRWQHRSQFSREQRQHWSALVTEQGRIHLRSSGLESEPLPFSPQQHLHFLVQCLCPSVPTEGSGAGGSSAGGFTLLRSNQASFRIIDFFTLLGGFFFWEDSSGYQN